VSAHTESPRLYSRFGKALAKPFARAAREEKSIGHPRGLDRILNLTDFEAAAEKVLPRAIYGYVASGAEDETSLHTNRNAFLDYRLVTRVLRGVQERNQSRSVFGKTYAAPFGIAPMGGASVVTYDGDRNLARAAHATGIPWVLSGNSITPLEKLARAYPGAWFASYQSANPSAVERMVKRVADAGYSAYVMTADVPVGSNREKDHRAGFTQPIRLNPKLVVQGAMRPRWVIATALRTLLKYGNPHVVNLDADGGPSLFSSQAKSIASHAGLAWQHVEIARRHWQGPLVVKGILSTEDVRIARECGVDGIVVSNHGGRQLDAAATPLQVLPGILAAANNLAVMVDGGFRRGTDVLVALALGARFVFIGRPFLFAAAIAGSAGVLHAIGLLSKEIDRDMALLGLHDLAELGPDMLLDVRRSPVSNTATS
jgi:L-lactate dehydrogenase (cytochrome)